MAYNENLPQPTDQLRDSQNDILNNFQGIKTLIDINHVTFDLADQGKHTYVTFPVQAAGPVIGADECAIYSKDSTLSGEAELFFMRESSLTEVEFTSYIGATPGWSRLPSGILLKWGTSTANGAATIVLPVAADTPAFTTIYSVQVSVVAAGAADANRAIRVVGFANPAQFDVYGSTRSATGAAATNFEYLVIGE